MNRPSAPHITNKDEHTLVVQVGPSVVSVRFKGILLALSLIYTDGTEKPLILLDGNRWLSEEEAQALADQEGRENL